MLQVELTKILGQAADTVDKPRDRKAQRCTSGSPLTNGAICRDGTCSSGTSINCAVRVGREVVSASLHTHVAKCPPLQAAHEACDNSSRLSGALTCLTCRLFMQYFEYHLSVCYWPAVVVFWAVKLSTDRCMCRGAWQPSRGRHSYGLCCSVCQRCFHQCCSGQHQQHLRLSAIAQRSSSVTCG